MSIASDVGHGERAAISHTGQASQIVTCGGAAGLADAHGYRATVYVERVIDGQGADAGCCGGGQRAAVQCYWSIDGAAAIQSAAIHGDWSVSKRWAIANRAIHFQGAVAHRGGTTVGVS